MQESERYRFGVFNMLYKNEMHIIPCDVEGFALTPHIKDIICICEPAIIIEDGVLTAIHNSFH